MLTKHEKNIGPFELAFWDYLGKECYEDDSHHENGENPQYPSWKFLTTVWVKKNKWDPLWLD